MKSIFILVAGAVLGVLALAFVPSLRGVLPGDHGHEQADGHTQPASARDHHDTVMKLTDEQLRLANITLAEVKGGELRRHFLVPGSIVPSADRIARVSVRLLGTVAELRKRLGDTVARGEVVAVIESREERISRRAVDQCAGADNV